MRTYQKGSVWRRDDGALVWSTSYYGPGQPYGPLGTNIDDEEDGIVILAPCATGEPRPDHCVFEG